MRTRLTWAVLFSAVIIVATLYHTRKAHATAAQGFASTTIALGRFGEIDVFNKLIPPANKGDLWLSFQQTKGSSDLCRTISGNREEALAGTPTLVIA